MKLPRWFKLTMYIMADFFAFFTIWTIVALNHGHFLTEYPFILIGSLIQLVLLLAFRVYRIITLHFGILDAVKLFLLSLLLNALFALSYHLIALPLNFLEFSFALAALPLALVGLRVSRRLLALWLHVKNKDTQKLARTLVIGAGAAGKLIIDEIRTNSNLHSKVVVVVDDDQEKVGRSFLGIAVRGPITNVASIINDFNVQQVVIAIGNITRTRLFEILRLLEKSNVKVRRLPLMEELEKGQQMKMKDVSVNELLGRDVIPLINDEIKAFIRNQVVLVTGAGGSIGSELVRQIFTYEPKALILVDLYENGVYDVQQELVKFNRQREKPILVHVQIGSTYNYERMNVIFQSFQPNLVFHAAAYKHVPLMEDSPQEAVRTNVLGTYNIAKLSSEWNVKKMVLVSTDKAVRPTNVMGATKYYAEAIIRYFSNQSKTTAYSAVRFGNVLASNGSVIPLFKKQIEAGGPVTVTHKEITRYFMTIPEAVGLILQSSVYATGGEIFVLDMGQPVKIVDLAEKMIRQSGYIPYEEINIEFTGLRPGEKMYEELLLDPKMNIRTPNEKIFIERTKKLNFDAKKYEHLVALSLNNDGELVNELFEQIKSYPSKKSY
jgi:FlaA1/EpsC-like NDP-sugar epimerase